MTATTQRPAELPPEPPSTDLVQEAVRVMSRQRRLERELETVTARRREIVAELYRRGLSQATIGRLLDLSRQRVTQYVEELRQAGELPPAPTREPDDDDA